MSTFDALVGADAHGVSSPQPRLGAYRLTDVTAAAGTVVWLGLAGTWLAGLAALSLVELYLSLAMLVLVPLGLGLAATPRQSGGSSRLYLAAIGGQLPAALVAVLGFTHSPGTIERLVLLLPWAAVTVVISGFGLWRVGSHGLRPLPELSIDAALLYVPVASAFLLFHALEITFHFSPLIVLLTGIHFHYAGFVLPLVVGLVGRRVAGDDGSFESDAPGLVAAAGTVGVIAGITLVALAITISPVLDLPTVVVFALAVLAIVLVVLTQIVPSVPRTPGLLLTVAAVSIVVTMGFAVAYAYSVFPYTASVITIPGMIRWHGTINVFGFALPGLVAFRLLES